MPFNIPQAPVAGFSPQQQQAFGEVGAAQGQAQPYYNQAQQYFNQSATPNISQFFNPYASAVTANLNDIFGQQQQQTTGQLTQAAGGVGADRIAVGQSELAKQQGLIAGQTLANLYAPSLSAAQQEQNIQQGAGYGTASLGSAAQNASLTGANALLGTGGLQQQLQQAQLNSPYQLALAQAAFPYQQSQFLSGTVGALAPGLGGTTSGQGTSTPAQPSLISQILGAGTAAAGIYGGFNGSGSSGKGSGGNFVGNNSVGGAPLSGYGGVTPSAYSPYYGPGFARGGDVGFADGGAPSPYQLPPNFNDNPINVGASSVIPNEQLSPIRANIPQLNLNPPAASGGSGGGADVGKAIGTAVQLAGMFMKKGGRVDPKKFDGANPYGFAEGGDTDVINPDEPFRMPDQAAVDDWRSGADSAMAFSGDGGTGMAFPPPRGGHGRSSPVREAEDANPYATSPAASEEGRSGRDAGLAGSPWAALTAAGLGMLAGTSPFAGVNIGQGGLQGVKTLEAQRAAAQKDETIDQAAKRLSQEAKFHEDQYSKMTPYQKEQTDLHRKAAEFQQMQPVKVGVDPVTGYDIMARKDPKSGQYINTLTGQPVDVPSAPAAGPKYNIPGPQSNADDAALPPHARLTQGVNAPEGVNPEVLAQLPAQQAATIRAIDEGRQSLTSVPLRDRKAVINQLNAYDPNFDQSVWTLRNAQQRELSTNGNAGKMILAVNQLLPHLKTASDKAQELENSNYPAANSIKNWWATATGDPAVKKFETVREVAAMDAARLLRGSGAMAEQDIDFWRKNIAAQASPAQLQETLKLLADDLMGARISSIQQAYRTNMRMEPPDFVSKEAKEALEAIKSRGEKLAGTPTAAAAATPGPAPAAAAKPDQATRYQQLTASGLSKEAAFAKMHEEGY